MITSFRRVLGAAILVGASMLTGCATIIHGTTQDVSFSSTPTGATVQLSDGRSYTTPCKVELKRNTDFIATISMPGYQQQVIPINSVLSGWLAGNILLGGIIGGGVDLASGAAYSLTPENVAVTLQPGGNGAVATAPVTVMSTEDKLRAVEKLHAEGVLKDNEYEASKAKLMEELTKGKGT